MNGARSAEAVSRLQEAFATRADPERAKAMAAYMRDQFPFLGIASPERRALQKAALKPLGEPAVNDALTFADQLWQLPEREYQYAAADVLAANAKYFPPSALPQCAALITTKSWWDTVDALASHVVGPIVLRNPGAEATMDAWIASPDMWLRRTAILHQLTYKKQTDTGRLFRYCAARAHENEFFIRKAIGWALRQYSWTDSAAVEAFVAANHDALSGLSRREALLAINGGRKKKAPAS